jgi:hypothetical protein
MCRGTGLLGRLHLVLGRPRHVFEGTLIPHALSKCRLCCCDTVGRQILNNPLQHDMICCHSQAPLALLSIFPAPSPRESALGLGPLLPTSAPGLGPPLPTSPPGLGLSGQLRAELPRRTFFGQVQSMCGAVGSKPSSVSPGLGQPLPHLRWDWARPPISAPGLGSLLPHLHRDWAHSFHICTGTGLTPSTSAPGLGSLLPHLHRDWAHPPAASATCCICTGTGRTCRICIGTGLAWDSHRVPFRPFVFCAHGWETMRG